MKPAVVLSLSALWRQ